MKNLVLLGLVAVSFLFGACAHKKCHCDGDKCKMEGTKEGCKDGCKMKKDDDDKKP